MAYFPFFIDIENKLAIVVGGGIVAKRKVEKLLLFGVKLKIIAPIICDELKDIIKRQNIEYLEKGIAEKDLDGVMFVIAATDSEATNKMISDYCNKSNILVNTIDDIEKCTFLFPALVNEGLLTIGISTSGKNPESASYIKALIKNVIPSGVSSSIEVFSKIRNVLKNKVSEQRKRADILKKVFDYCEKNNFKKSEDEILVYFNEQLKSQNEREGL